MRRYTKMFWYFMIIYLCTVIAATTISGLLAGFFVIFGALAGMGAQQAQTRKWKSGQN